MGRRNVSAFGQTAFLAGDIDNTGGNEDMLAAEIGKVDLLKLGHHGAPGANSDAYLETLHPKIAIQTGSFAKLWIPSLDRLNRLGTKVYSTYDSAMDGREAIVATFSNDGIAVDSKTAPALYGAKIPRPVAGENWMQRAYAWFWFDNGSDFIARDAWRRSNGAWYYLQPSGIMATEWQLVDDSWYYLGKYGAMAADTWIDGEYVGQSGRWDSTRSR